MRLPQIHCVQWWCSGQYTCRSHPSVHIQDVDGQPDWFIPFNNIGSSI